jgi:hypothetical protein
MFIQAISRVTLRISLGAIALCALIMGCAPETELSARESAAPTASEARGIGVIAASHTLDGPTLIEGQLQEQGKRAYWIFVDGRGCVVCASSMAAALAIGCGPAAEVDALLQSSETDKSSITVGVGGR